jgi:tetratricopeptide (TPR) repeat protein
MAFGPITSGHATTRTEQTHLEKAEALFRARKLPEALAEYKLAIKENADNAAAYMGAGDCHYHLGQLNLATAFFEESIAIEVRPSTLRFLGDAHRKSGRIQAAIRAYERALEVDPSYEIARQQLEAVRQNVKAEAP